MRNILPAAALAAMLAACAGAPSSADRPDARAASAAAQSPPIGCVNGTGTRLPVKPDTCTGFGSVYAKPTLDSTGTPYPQQSLQMLDPVVRTAGGVVP